MTTVLKEKKKCAVCGAEYDYPNIASTNAFGSQDLDTRPPEMERSTIFAWVQRCPDCGYCASDISKASAQAAMIIRSNAYREQLTDPALPELANSFLCKSIIEEAAGDYASAAWSLIHAAWVCDDEEKADSAKKCRNMAIAMVLQALEKGQEFTRQRGAETAVLVDLLRRAGRFSEAKELIATKRGAIEEEVIVKVLAFQEVLIGRRDEACHTIAEALGEEE